MTDHPHQLYAIPFREADQRRLVDFSCGCDNWSRHVAQWIRGSDVVDSIANHGTRVWLFETVDHEIVGFGSVGTCRWRWPLPDGSYTRLVLIPMLGVAERFHGKPEDRNWRYSIQIMSHLIDESQRLAREKESKGNNVEWLVLLVQRDNQRAIQFYTKCGFELIPGVVRRNDHVVMKLWIGETCI